MMKQTLSALLLSSALALPAMAQGTTAPATPAAPAAPKSDMGTMKSTTEKSAAMTGDTFVKQSMAGEWRASKLAGLSVYGPDNKSIGKIDDVITDKSGSIKTVVIAVGGVLGIGAKNVGVPFDAVTWVNEPMKAGSDVTSTIPKSTTGQTGSTAPAATASKDTVYDYPDHAAVAMTTDQLKSAPEFHYASENK